MITPNGINYIKSTGDEDVGAVFFNEFRRKAAIKDYPITGYYAQLFTTNGYEKLQVIINNLFDLETNFNVQDTNVGVSNLKMLFSQTEDISSPFPVNTFVTSTSHRISFGYHSDNSKSYNIMMLYAFDEIELYDRTPDLNSIIDNLFINSGNKSLGRETREKYLCGILKFSENMINFSDVNTIIDLSDIIIPQCSFKCLIESGMNNISHYQSNYLKAENIYDNDVSGNQFVFKQTAQHLLNGKISNEDPKDGTMTIAKSGLIKY